MKVATRCDLFFVTFFPLPHISSIGLVYIYLHLPIKLGSYGYLRTDGKEAEIDISISSLVGLELRLDG